jgi:hypothetical protein
MNLPLLFSTFHGTPPRATSIHVRPLAACSTNSSFLEMLYVVAALNRPLLLVSLSMTCTLLANARVSYLLYPILLL